MFKRRRRIIDRTFQLKTTFKVISVSLLAFLVIMAMTGITATRNNREITRAVAGINGAVASGGGPAALEELKRHSADLENSARRNFYLITVILAAVLAQCAVLYFYLIRLTHRISGPIYVISRHIEEILEGHHPEFRALRDRDEFKEFYEKFIEMVEKQSRGTEITLHLRDGQDDLLEGHKLRGIVRKYSNHIVQPILMKKEEWKDDQQQVTDEDETVNQASALWARPKSEITDEQYQEFYKHVGHDYDDPLAWSHARVEGRQEYTQLLYIPAHAPFDMWDRQSRHGVKLYVRRVFIMDDAEQLMPTYLRFVRGVVDSSDLPLNVSREILQESKDIEAIRKGCTGKVLALLADLAESDKEKYATFWGEFGKALKEGIGEDHANKDKIAGLLRFASTHADTSDEAVSLKDYIARMKEGQEKIYYVTAETFNAAKNSPHLEVFRKKGIEVLLMSDRVDEWAMSYLTEFDGKPLASVAKGGLDLGKLEDEAEKQAQEKEADEFKPLTDKIKASLAGRVKEVRITHRLTDSPACLVADEHDLSGNLARMLKAAGQTMPTSQPILEINPQHPVVLRLKSEEKRFDDWAAVLFDQAMLAEGGQLDDPATFVKRVNQLMLEMGS